MFKKLLTGAVQLQGGQIGFNKDSQFNIFVQDGDLYFYRSVEHN